MWMNRLLLGGVTVSLVVRLAVGMVMVASAVGCAEFSAFAKDPAGIGPAAAAAGTAAGRAVNEVAGNPWKVVWDETIAVGKPLYYCTSTAAAIYVGDVADAISNGMSCYQALDSDGDGIPDPSDPTPSGG